LVPGDRVYAWDQRREKMVTAVVERLIRRPSTMVSTLELCSGARIVTTGNHPFFSSVETGFIHAGTLTPRDQVMVMRHRRLVSERICAITVGGHRPVYTLSVSSPHTYFACGVLVHNY
ncbi:hypothetical protein KJ865_15265, partial [Myxococcota bacterium]|nr:hypothetical protein [Myxococcota bacterium]